ncbi:hypothetical protein [Streptomyces sp. NBC_01190]|uniref:hypothetical protein n=1 Tax=Streptomyces sp. NBC_01190 TaxID=2903767 RepID=UPI003863150E|nr:hypothetical protein OG519_15195 [Streptomyces sp. NBC_01190]
MPERPPSAPGNINSPGHATGGLGEDTVAARLDTMEQRLGSIERILFALARAKGVDPETTG